MRKGRFAAYRANGSSGHGACSPEASGAPVVKVELGATRSAARTV